MFKRIKNLFKPSIKKQVTKLISKDTSVEHAFVKLPRKKITEVSLEKTKHSVTLDEKKVKEYLLKHKNDGKHLSYIHIHTYDNINIHFPSVPDLLFAFSKEKPQHIILKKDKKEVGRISYNFTINNTKQQSSILNQILKINTIINNKYF